MPRFYCPLPLATGDVLDLPAGAARHVQVLRLQPGDGLTLFNGQGGEFEASVLRMSRSDVQVTVGQHQPVEREAATAVHLAVGMPANERMDWLVEKATELGVASIQPLVTERTVLRLTGERAEKKQLHWQSIAVAACEQSGRNRVPVVFAVKNLSTWVKSLPNDLASATGGPRWLLSLSRGSQPLQQLMALRTAVTQQAAATFLSGPEGGLSPAEEQAALAASFSAVSLGLRVLRAETAALAALAVLA